MRDIRDIKETILSMPTFFQHFDGLMIDYKYLLIRSQSQIEKEAKWLKRQNIDITVDFRSGCNYYPDITLLETLPLRYNESIKDIEDVLVKMAILSAKNTVFKFHRNGEWTNDEEAFELYVKTFKYLVKKMESSNISFNLQPHISAMPLLQTVGGVLKIINQIGSSNVKLALGINQLQKEGLLLTEKKDLLGLVLLSSSLQDRFGQVYDAHLSFHNLVGLEIERIRDIKQPLFLDGRYRNWDEIYLEIKKMNSLQKINI